MIGNSGACLKSLAAVQVELVYNPSENFTTKKRLRLTLFGKYCFPFNLRVFYIISLLTGVEELSW